MCNSKRLCANEDCKTRFKNSFASHEKSKYWSEKNGHVNPIHVFKGYSVIRILQEYVWNDAYDWLNELNQNIAKITSENTIQNIYMCKNNEYNFAPPLHK
jgi:hypothetical protein